MLKRYHYVDLFDGECLSLTAKSKNQADVYAIFTLREPIFIKSEGVNNNDNKRTDIKRYNNR